MALDRTWYNTLVDDDGSGLTGSVWDKADVDSLMDAVDAEIARFDTHHYCELYSGNLLAIAHAVWTTIQFSAAGSNNFGMWSSGNPGYVTIPVAGIYLVTGGVAYAPNGAGSRMISIWKNNLVLTPLEIKAAHPSSNTTVHTVNLIQPLGAGDAIQLTTYQDSGVSLNCGFQSSGNVNMTNYFRVYRLSA
jgi:hypothetical protein